MKRLSEKEWGEFYIGDLFSVSRPKARNKDDYIYGDVPFVASGAVNNGVMKCCKGKENEVLDAGNCLTVSPVDGSTFYQPMDFLGRGGAGSSILMLRSDSIQPDFGQFIARAVQQTCSKYSYGHMGNKDSIKRERVMLPVDDKGNPDYAYMTLYSAGARGGMLMRYKNFIAEQLSQLEHKDIPALDEKEWKQFGFAEVFDIKKGFYNKKPESDGTGTIPFLGATDSNNGVTRFLTLKEIKHGTKTGDLHNSPLEKKLFPGHAIAVTNNGSVGHAFYQATEFTCSHDINPLYLRDHEMSREDAAFLVKAIEQQGILFQYARKWRPIRMVKSKILLPVDDTGKPDYKYMEQYAKNMMLRKYEQYLAFIDRQSSAEEVNV